MKATEAKLPSLLQGNGDVEVGLTSLDELPYVMGLVRQSSERQVGDGGQA